MNKQLLFWLIIFLLSSVYPDGMFAQSDSDKEPQTSAFNPNLKFPTLQAYEAELKESGVMFDDARLCLFAPKRKSEEAKIIFEYLLKAYDELYNIVGMHTKYKMVVYHFPENSEYCRGGTSECTIWYDCKNLDLDQQEEWIKYKTPHLSGYIEEMAHNFVDASGAHFGWEMIGWSLGVRTAKKVAGNPILAEQAEQTRSGQMETFRRFRNAGCVFPKDLPANLCDRVHAHILWMCENRYGNNFWQDFFTEIRREQGNLKAAKELKDPDKIRNRKYQITIDCFDRLPKVEFKNLLKKNQISLLVDVKSLHPTDQNWNRKFLCPEDCNEPAEASDNEPANQNNPIVVDVNELPPLHKAVYGGHSQMSEQFIEQGANVNEKSPNGWTPLHIAAIGGHRILSELLLNKGADIKVMDNNGRTAAKLAEACGHNGLAEFLHSKEQE
ncbi:MAG TPA: hypothetical protein DDW84_03365 [Phycisphaerales bacterium]|nr:hypothetical protein [Phycisphaerales bacterium]